MKTGRMKYTVLLLDYRFSKEHGMPIETKVGRFLCPGDANRFANWCAMDKKPNDKLVWETWRGKKKIYRAG